MHNQLQTALYAELSQQYGADCVATELNCGSGSRIDLVVKKESGYSLYEIKTSSSAKSCIREALGQLMEYAFYNDNINIDKLIIVSPHELKHADVEYLARIKKKFTLPIVYMPYSL